MPLSTLNAISPVDGRYYSKLEKVSNYFSEFALIKYRVVIEVAYLKAMLNLGLPQFLAEEGMLAKIDTLFSQFTVANAETIKDTERITNHDVKAVEYFIKDKLVNAGLGAISEVVHFGLTSQDINNTAVPLSLKDASQELVIPQLQNLIAGLDRVAIEWSNIPMLARTHGQPASPTRLGKEMQVFAQRLKGQLVLLQQVPFSAKFGGATGGFNAHYAAFPTTNWHQFAEEFVAGLGLSRTFPTTQIEPYDNLAAWCDGLKRLSTILIDCCRDVWQYISLGYFTQQIQKNEVGSSAMPHKVNPIDFENAEGNLGITIALLEHFAAKLPISRLQRDLTDSTVLRNLGVPVAHFILSLQSIEKGLGKLNVNRPAINADLESNAVVIAEGIQTILRREGYPNPYEALKALTRVEGKITLSVLAEFVETLNVSQAVKQELLALTPFNYTGR